MMMDNKLFLRNEKGIPTLPSGIPELDCTISTLPKSALVLIAARPLMGKTALALQMVREISLRQNKPAAYFVMGIAKKQLLQRLLCAELEIDIKKATTGEFTHVELNRLTATSESINNVPLLIFDDTALSVKSLQDKVRQLKKQFNLEAIFIDYLQLMHGHDNLENRKIELAEIVKELKSLAEELQLTVVLLSQLTKTLEKRTDRRPALTDLLEYGEIESSADMVMFIYRDSYYDKNSSMGNKAEIIIAKHSYGPTGKIDLNYCEQYQKYVAATNA